MKNNKGFTLVEVVVATAILSLVAIMFFGLFTTSNAISLRASLKRDDTQDVSSQLQNNNKTDCSDGETIDILGQPACKVCKVGDNGVELCTIQAIE
ncbi:MAG: PulJ/GspJ family protein [Erysipelotrichaceae bacterium]